MECRIFSKSSNVEGQRLYCKQMKYSVHVDDSNRNSNILKPRVLCSFNDTQNTTTGKQTGRITDRQTE